MNHITRLLTLLFIATSSTIYAQIGTSQVGGFDYAWADYEPADFAPLNITFDYTGARSISHAPAIGEHPRIFFNMSDVADIQDRVTNTASGQEAFAQMHAYTTLLNLGYNANGTYSNFASYARDAADNKRIDNPGKWDSSPIYTDLINNVPTALDGVDVKRRYLLCSVMLLEALECLLKSGETDPDTGEAYDDRADDLALAMDYWATLVIGDPELNSNNYNYFGGQHMAMCYDIHFNSMTTAQQDNVRTALAAIIPAQPRYGPYTEPYATTSNWCGLNTFEVLTNMAIEGEAGYNAQLTEDYMKGWRNFITYGWYESGAPYEGMGKNYQFVGAMIAMAKRGYSLLGHPYVKAFGEDYLPQITMPQGHAFNSVDVWGGTGWDVETGGYKFHSNDILGLKWTFPNSSKIDFAWRNYIEKWHRIDSEGYVYQQIEPSSNGYNPQLALAVIFANDYTEDDWETQNTNALQGLSYLAPERGESFLRSGYSQDDMMIYFNCRQDLGGHTHGDRNTFNMNALGRIFVPYTFGSHFQDSKHHSIVLVDDTGIAITEKDGRKARQPGKILGFSDDGTLAQTIGDATYAYSWEWHWETRPASQPHSWLSNGDGWTEVTETWNDFRYIPGTEFYHDIPFYDYAHWNAEDKLERMIKRPANTMERVYRTTSMVRGNHSFGLIIDDIQKDSEVHNYKWAMQIASDLSITSTDVNLDLNDWRLDAILSEADGNRKMLVRVLNNEGYISGAPAYTEDITEVPAINGINPVMRLVVEADVVAPDFQVMLFPYVDGDELPVTTWNATKDTLTVTFSDEERILALNNIDGLTQLSLITAALPVEWVDVAANANVNNHIDIDWSVIENDQNIGYTLERSIDMINFEDIAEISKMGDEGNTVNYTYEDESVAVNTTYYYRIKQTDQNATFVYSMIVSAEVIGVSTNAAESLSDVKIFPQPFDNQFTIEIPADADFPMLIQIYTIDGRIISTYNIAADAISHSVDANDWANGTYIVRIIKDEQVLKQMNIVKQ